MTTHKKFDPAEEEQRDCYYTVCPYCGEGHENSHIHNHVTEPNERDCGECGKTFIQWADVSVTYCTTKK